MEVILLERVAKLGQMGDTVKVKDGYARNFLLPNGKALRATKANKERFAGERVQLEARNLELKTEAQAISERLDGRSFVLIRQAGESGQLYGSVSARDLSEVATSGGYTIERSQIVLNSPIKTLGLHQVTVQLHPDVAAKVTVNVARSNEEAERQSRGENVSAYREDEDETYENPEDVQIPGVPGTGEQPDV
jgi:large subunit ribosomal protein L9